MKKLVPDPPAISLSAPPSPEDCNTLIHVLTLTLQQSANVLLDSPQGPQRDAMGMNIRVLCRMINALNEHATAQGAT
ncbi:hypothetical protein [Pseudomonas sp. KU43P]|uniref:hypothetical protein n=1 Tax=Pseudomonas sp. KU43P TaxID=2487887 RepID=UPI0012A99BF0|nr:hypothetical protein [Pseudomonas sp. KU43P]BBH43680.1 hypothetical protein KU43P_01570 [Pseudomonas sp. KU43P]